ncbi:hypothetical protein IMG5_048400 [Ichthyophthirius multifiliis]|uniref:Uncharacterized protein n=1 Tax=Ichthyophthirius multifiliis TaxID=5932 RepID=G0QMG3_ICHMU|nr:hypothetical protein IMG5_048400 [Ichthyophthirius multifiliis]EGR33598.1 hypothetical protein IMG5_048400 [Ichthyophthirius multifiliis]|eukprot:XP_004037584.1 hypothetical protein IMG5_048400 [Ichthyophthirius multifiliis]
MHQKCLIKQHKMKNNAISTHLFQVKFLAYKLNLQKICIMELNMKIHLNMTIHKQKIKKNKKKNQNRKNKLKKNKKKMNKKQKKKNKIKKKKKNNKIKKLQNNQKKIIVKLKNKKNNYLSITYQNLQIQKKIQMTLHAVIFLKFQIIYQHHLVNSIIIQKINQKYQKIWQIIQKQKVYLI